MAQQEPDPIDPDPDLQPQILRFKAQKTLSSTRSRIAEMSKVDTQILAHELQVHQMELEIQNEELRRTQLELAVSRSGHLLPLPTERRWA